MEVPIELIEQIERGNCVLFLGWEGPETRETGAPQVLTEKVLARRLADRVHYPKPVGPLYDIAEYFEVERGRHALIEYVCDVIQEYENRCPDYYQAVVKLPFNIIVTTSLDDSLEWILRTQGRKFVRVVRDEEVSFIDDDKPLIVKLYGDVENRISIVITREDHMAFFDQLPNMSDLLKYFFKTKTLLFLGYNLDDPHFLQFYAYANQRTKRYQRRAYAVKPNPTQYRRRLWESRNLTLLDASPDEFLAELASRIGQVAYLPPKDPLVALADELAMISGVHKSPYKFLSSFEEQDIDIFFGRDHDIVRATRKLLSSKLTILYGKSGFGKTSLICAGITPRLIRSNYLPVYARVAADPLLSIKTNTIDRVLQLGRDGSTSDNLKRLQSAADLSMPSFIRELKEVEDRSLVVFIDQFEEFFISLGDATRKQFEREVAECINSPYIDATFVLSLREDFLPELHELRRLRNVYESLYRLKALTIAQASQAIVRPAEKFGITYEAGLVSQIIQQLSDKDQIDPAQLQIVCDRLYNSLEERETRISMALYNELGGVRQILADYVDSKLDEFGPKRRSVAQKLLRGMVTSLFTRTMLLYSDAVLETSDIPDWTESDTKDLLRDLVQARLVRRVADVEEESYELTHEYLINKIQEWIDLEALKVKEAQDLLRREHNNWQRHKIPMDKSALKIVDAQRERLMLNNDLKAFILAAAARYDFEFDYWINRNQENQQAIDLLVWLLKEDEPNAKRLAGIALGLLSDDLGIIDEVYSVHESVANPNTVKRIEQLQSQGFPFGEGFLENVRQIVEHRFTKNMIFVEAGEFLMGTSQEEIDAIAQANQVPLSFFEGQYPQRKVYVDGFYIDKFLVTNAEFQEFKPTHTFPVGHEDHPATSVTWYEALEYARWVGKELPTEEEWEKAARGTDGRRFAWGEEWDPERCNTRLSGYGGTTPVDQFPSGVSPYGCYDLCGNVWEWTSTWLNEEKKQKVLKGSSWSKYGILPWCWYRFNYEPDSGYINVGFRCIRHVRLSNEQSGQPGSPRSVYDSVGEE